VLAVISRDFAENVIFFGGTALARTHLTSGRLSEDLDLIARHDRKETAAQLDKTLPRSLLREFGRLDWAPSLSRTRDDQSATISIPQGVSLRIQLLSATGYPAWPTEMQAMEQRYSDSGPATLRVPTRAAFAAWKTVAWADRAAPRDLWDLAGLARIGAIDSEARTLFVSHGPTANPPAPWMFSRAPSAESWQAQLGGQTRLTIEPGQALAEVRSAWRATLTDDLTEGEPWDVDS